MKKSTMIIVAVAAVVVVLLLVLFFMTGNSSNLPAVNSAEDLSKLVDSIYANVTSERPMVMSQEVDVTDKDTVKNVTGLENGDELEYLVVSEPMMSSQAYSMVIAKVKPGANASNIAKTMLDSVNTRKWVCVTAEKVYATNSGNVVFLVMTEANLAKEVFNSFKTLAGNVGQEFERTEEEPELPPEMY